MGRQQIFPPSVWPLVLVFWHLPQPIQLSFPTGSVLYPSTHINSANFVTRFSVARLLE